MFCVFYAHLKGFMGTRVHAVAAADAFTAVGICGRIDTHFAGLGACVAAHTFILIEVHAVQRDLVEKAVDCAQRADEFAERPVDNKAADKDKSKDNEFQAE